MSENYFSADLHLFHEKIIAYTKRPFSNLDAMGDTILANFNARIRKQDTLHLIGDVAFGTPEMLRRWFARLICKNVHLVHCIGAHDSVALRAPELFRSISNLKEIKVNGQYLTLCHYAMRTWPRSIYGSYQLFGHSHGTLPNDPNLLQMDVGVDPNKFQPVSFAEVQAYMSGKTFRPIQSRREQDKLFQPNEKEVS